MSHWKSFHIDRFRRLEDIELECLGSVNLLVGKNNCGKTSVLEALAIASHPSDAFTWIDIGRERELKSARTPVLEVLNWFFPHKAPRENGFEGAAALEGDFLTGGRARIEASYREFRAVSMTPESESSELQILADDESEYAASLSVVVKQMTEDGREIGQSTVHEFAGTRYLGPKRAVPFLPYQFVSPVAHRADQQLLVDFDRLLEKRLKDEIVRLMQSFASDVDDIEIRSPEGRRAVIHLHHKSIGHVPLSAEGDGMRRAFAFAAAATLARNGVMLVDEIETALHPEALAEVFKFLVNICQSNNVQLFVSTHSLEAVDAMLESLGDNIASLVAFRLPARGSGHPLKRFSGQTISDLRHEGGLDLR